MLAVGIYFFSKVLTVYTQSTQERCRKHLGDQSDPRKPSLSCLPSGLNQSPGRRLRESLEMLKWRGSLALYHIVP